jgi:hypothetical protein
VQTDYEKAFGLPEAPTPEKKPMTVDELLAKLDAEYVRLESELPEHFLSYGRFKYSYPTDTSYHHDKAEIERKQKRQNKIREIQSVIRIESERVTA